MAFDHSFLQAVSVQEPCQHAAREFASFIQLFSSDNLKIKDAKVRLWNRRIPESEKFEKGSANG